MIPVISNGKEYLLYVFLDSLLISTYSFAVMNIVSSYHRAFGFTINNYNENIKKRQPVIQAPQRSSYTTNVKFSLTILTAIQAKPSRFFKGLCLKSIPVTSNKDKHGRNMPFLKLRGCKFASLNIRYVLLPRQKWREQSRSPFELSIVTLGNFLVLGIVS